MAMDRKHSMVMDREREHSMGTDWEVQEQGDMAGLGAQHGENREEGDMAMDWDKHKDMVMDWEHRDMVMVVADREERWRQLMVSMAMGDGRWAMGN